MDLNSRLLLKHGTMLKHGTAMGPKNACSYADLAMGLIDEKAWGWCETIVVAEI